MRPSGAARKSEAEEEATRKREIQSQTVEGVGDTFINSPLFSLGIG